MTYVKCRSQSSEMLATFPSKRMTSFNMAGDQWRNICGAVELVGRQGRVVCDITFTMFAYKLPASASNLTPITTTTDPQSLNQCSRIFSAQKPSIDSLALVLLVQPPCLEVHLECIQPMASQIRGLYRCLHMALIENGVYHCIPQNPLVDC